MTACASGTHSIGDAFRAIQYGDAEVMAGRRNGELYLSDRSSRFYRAYSTYQNRRCRSSASIPFDKDRSGFVLGEGAGIVVLEELEHAKARGAKIYAELVGYGATADAFHITSPAEDGAGAARAMELAMEEAGVQPDQRWTISTHMEQVHTTMTCLRQERSRRRLEMRQKI